MSDDKKLVVWSNEDLDLDDWREDLLADHPDYSEDELYRLMCETNDEYLNDERMNLDIVLKQPILVIADLGLWNGRKSGYKELKSGNIKDCLYTSCDYATWYVNSDGDFCCDAIHHDGTNHYLYRTYRSGVTEWQKAALTVKLYNGAATWEDIDRVTRRIGPEICKVYGWKCPRRKAS